MPGLRQFLDAYTQGLNYRPEQERQSTKIRLFVAFAIVCYVTITYQVTGIGHIPTVILYAMFIHVVSSILLFVSTLLSPRTHPLRCIAAFTLDLATGTVIMIAGGESTAWIYGGFMWVIIAYGIRFGKAYMFTAHMMAIAGFTITIANTPFWQDQLAMSLGLMVWLVVLPFYVAKLIDAMDEAIQKAFIANQAKSRFLANMSHEIRTPLTAIVGYSESALDHDQTMADRLHALNIIRSSGQHLQSIINDILDFSKIEADEMDIEHIPLNPFQIMADVEAIVATYAIQKGLAFEVDYQFPIPISISSDPLRLKQILLNLGHNAIKFTNSGLVKFTIRCLAESNKLQIFVTDTGIGMTNEQRQTIFKPFKQAETSTSRNFGGTGLGLSLSKKLASLLGGDLHVESQPGSGTTFILTIPCGETGNMANNMDEVDLPRQQEYAVVTDQYLNGTILLAEDNETNRQLISAILRKMGATVSTAEDGKQALEMALKQRYDLIYMDMQMPVMSGVDAVTELRLNHYQAPIVALTANATREDREICLDAGCDDYLTKPVNRDRLFATSARYLQVEQLLPTDEKGMEPIHSELLTKDSIISNLLNDFIDELSRMMTILKLAFVNEEWENMQVTVHDLKGMGGGFGYPQLSDLAEAMEDELKNNNYENVRYRLNDLDIMCKRIAIGKLPSSA